MSYVFCEQCDRMFYAQRSTAKFCGATCRKRAHRDAPKISYYQSKHLDKHEEIAAIIADKHPTIWRQLEDMRDYHGNKALRATLEILESVIRG